MNPLIMSGKMNTHEGRHYKITEYFLLLTKGLVGIRHDENSVLNGGSSN